MVKEDWTVVIEQGAVHQARQLLFPGGSKVQDQRDRSCQQEEQGHSGPSDRGSKAAQGGSIVNVSPIHIKVSRTERQLFETAAKKSGMTLTQLVKQAVLEYVRRPLPKDPFAEALDKLETFEPTAEQLAEHRAFKKRLAKGQTGPWLSPDEALAYLRKLDKKSK